MANRTRLPRYYDPSIPPLMGDPDQLLQALLNLMTNAARAALEGGGTVIVRTRVVRQMTIGNVRHRLVLVVQFEDNGPGIPAGLVDRIRLGLLRSVVLRPLAMEPMALLRILQPLLLQPLLLA